MSGDFRAFAATALLGLVQAAGAWTVEPADTGAALLNPGMGWVCHFYDNSPLKYGERLEPSDSLAWFPGCTTVYLRIQWSALEPEEGVFNWALLDTPAQRWIERGGKVAFRISCSEHQDRRATPEWVEKAGAKGVRWNLLKGPAPDGRYWDPDYLDPVFLEKLDNFLRAFAARYDGNPEVAFIDIGSFGLYGEGHTKFSSKLPREREVECLKRHIDLHVKHFKRTPLALSDDTDGGDNLSGDWPVMRYALERGVTFRDDSLFVRAAPKAWFHDGMAALFSPTRPIILETQHYHMATKIKAWDMALLQKAVEDFRASYLSIHGWPDVIYTNHTAEIAAISRRLGYRLMPLAVTFPDEVHIGAPFEASVTWANTGVAPCYGGGFAAFTLKDAKGGIVSVLSDESFDLRELKPSVGGERPSVTRTAAFRVGHLAPVTRPGEYDVYLSVGRRDGTPQLALPLAEDDGQRRYRIGRVTAAEAVTCSAGVSPADADEAVLGFANPRVTEGAEGSLVARIESAVIIPGAAHRELWVHPELLTVPGSSGAIEFRARTTDRLGKDSHAEWHTFATTNGFRTLEPLAGPTPGVWRRKDLMLADLATNGVPAAAIPRSLGHTWCSAFIYTDAATVLQAFTTREGTRYSVQTLVARPTPGGLVPLHVSNAWSNDKGRGLYEPHVAAVGRRCFMTARAEDGCGYVMASEDGGRTWGKPKPWTWDSGEPVAMNQTMTKFATHADGLVLVYTRIREDNASVFRNRSPLHVADVDLATLSLKRATERVIVPLKPSHGKGWPVGNFWVWSVSENETDVVTAEWPRDGRPENGDIWLAKLYWRQPNSAYRAEVGFTSSAP
ncbi:MAG TPA: DUF4832 domain-containing protein [Kiritimatiellia bacterium]|nr:DUF4832 domain-containing protein [Kiritimatiellia bacterium]HPO36940.1 DUF4832 domain-containing protein [Kiritimatiellia bacterium]HQL50371.1 DUF4832 domain-containing protein [Kiritimatiellia bacterium]HQQ91484.1 DUF4832 domain-containing protein [Kiritimatiellia bacterium]